MRKPVIPSRRQREMLVLIDGLTLARGFPPSVRELTAAMGINSTNGAAEHLRWCIRKGFVESTPKIARSHRLTAAGRAWLRVTEAELRVMRSVHKVGVAGAPKGNRNASRENRAAKAAREAAELAAARGAA